MCKGLELFNTYILSRLKNTDLCFMDVRNAVKQVEKELKTLEIIFKKFITPHDFVLCCYTMNNKKWIDYEEYKKAYMNYYEDDEYLLLEEEYELLKEVCCEQEEIRHQSH